jgi:hypothetical protein
LKIQAISAVWQIGYSFVNELFLMKIEALKNKIHSQGFSSESSSTGERKMNRRVNFAQPESSG